MTTAEDTLEFVPVGYEHLPMLSRWIATPHWQKWWGDVETETGYIRDMLDGRDTTRPFIFRIGGQDTGYIQYWFVADHLEGKWIDKNPWLLDLPPSAVGVDLSIADHDRLGHGIGSRVLEKFVRKLHDEGYHDIIIDPDSDNHRAISAYVKAGFSPIEVLEARRRGVHLMRYDPITEDKKTGISHD